MKVQKQPGEGLAALGAEPADLYVAAVTSGSAAEKAGLKAGDAARRLQWRAAALLLLSSRWSSASSRRSPSSSPGAARTAWSARQELAQAPIEIKDEMGQVSSMLALGVQPWVSSSADMPPLDKVTVHMGPGEALKEATLVVPKIIGQTVTVLAKLVTGQLSPNTVGGPVMMYQMAAKTSERGSTTSST